MLGLQPLIMSTPKPIFPVIDIVHNVLTPNTPHRIVKPTSTRWNRNYTQMAEYFIRFNYCGYPVPLSNRDYFRSGSFTEIPVDWSNFPIQNVVVKITSKQTVATITHDFLFDEKDEFHERYKKDITARCFEEAYRRDMIVLGYEWKPSSNPNVKEQLEFLIGTELIKDLSEYGDNPWTLK